MSATEGVTIAGAGEDWNWEFEFRVRALFTNGNATHSILG